MLSIIATMLTGILLGYIFRHKTIIQNTEKSIFLTILLLLFIMGLSIGSNKQIIDNLGAFGWQAAVIALSATCGSILASWIVLKLFFSEKVQS